MIVYFVSNVPEGALRFLPHHELESVQNLNSAFSIHLPCLKLWSGFNVSVSAIPESVNASLNVYT